MKEKTSAMSEEVTQVYCDICRKHTKDEMGNFEYAELLANWGYSSGKDGEVHACHICEKCYDKIVTFIRLLGGDITIEKSNFEVGNISFPDAPKNGLYNAGCDGNCSSCPNFKKEVKIEEVKTEEVKTKNNNYKYRYPQIVHQAFKIGKVLPLVNPKGILLIPIDIEIEPVEVGLNYEVGYETLIGNYYVKNEEGVEYCISADHFEKFYSLID